jgi:hypothetical protein
VDLAPVALVGSLPRSPGAVLLDRLGPAAAAAAVAMPASATIGPP